MIDPSVQSKQCGEAFNSGNKRQTKRTMQYNNREGLRGKKNLIGSVGLHHKGQRGFKIGKFFISFSYFFPFFFLPFWKNPLRVNLPLLNKGVEVEEELARG